MFLRNAHDDVANFKPVALSINNDKALHHAITRAHYDHIRHKTQ